MFLEYGPFRGVIEKRINGAIISQTGGTVIPFALFNLQDRGTFFVDVGEPLYEGQVVGENAKDSDMVVNLFKEKKLTNIRSAGAEEMVRITPPHKMSLEEALEYIKAVSYTHLDVYKRQVIRVHRLKIRHVWVVLRQRIGP